MVTGIVAEVISEAVFSRSFIMLKNAIFRGLCHGVSNRVSSFTFVAWNMFEADLKLGKSGKKIPYIKFFAKIKYCLNKLLILNKSSSSISIALACSPTPVRSSELLPFVDILLKNVNHVLFQG